MSHQPAHTGAMVNRLGTIVDITPSRGMFIVELDGGGHALFTLYDHIYLEVGDQLEGGLAEMGSERLLTSKGRQLFEAFGETGPAGLEECRRLMRG